MLGSEVLPCCCAAVGVHLMEGERGEKSFFSLLSLAELIWKNKATVVLIYICAFLLSDFGPEQTLLQ